MHLIRAFYSQWRILQLICLYTSQCGFLKHFFYRFEFAFIYTTDLFDFGTIIYACIFLVLITLFVFIV